jgi:hypothetical protein
MGKLRNVVLFCLKSEWKQATESFENMTNFHVLGKQINLSKLLTPKQPKIIFNSNKLSPISVLSSCHHLYKNIHTEAQSKNSKPDFNLGIEFRNLH